jgi:hypothetical protein
MRLMTRFTHDVETAELTADECAAYAGLVASLCNRPEQRRLSAYLSAVTRPQIGYVLTLAAGEAQRMWRDEARL